MQIRKDGASKDILLAFIKNPILGQVKTRLASSVGNEEAMRIYKELLGHTRKVSAGLAVTKVVCYSHYIENDDEWQTDGFVPYLQTGSDLGTRMSNAFRTAFLEGAKNVIVIGSDCPQISTTLLQTAFDALLNNEVVLGPSLDGGYYLLGMSRFLPNLFTDINWSTSSVLVETIKKAKECSIIPSLLPKLSDVDYLEDWQKYGW